MDISQFYDTDENGNQVELQRPETKSFDDVVQCIEHNVGSNGEVVQLFIDMYKVGLEWDWFDSYKAWLAECEHIEELNATLVPDEETGELPPACPLPAEPVLSIDRTLELEAKERAATKNQALANSTVLIGKHVFQADLAGIVSMELAIAEVNDQYKGAVPDDAVVSYPAAYLGRAAIAELSYTELVKAQAIARDQYNATNVMPPI